MERTRKRLKEESLRGSNKRKKSKPRKVFSSSCAVGTDEDHVGKTDHKTTSNGGDGRTGQRKLDSRWRDGKRSSTGGSEILEDQSTEFNKDYNPKKNKAKRGLLTNRRGRPRGTGLKKSIKKEKDGREESEMTKQAPNQQLKFYTCPCGKSYTSSSHLRRHQKINVECQHFREAEKSFSCLCGKSYSGRCYLSRHQKTCQAGSKTNLNSGAKGKRFKPYICSCGKGYTSSSCLYRHQRIHLHGNRESAKTYICDCGKMFPNRSRLLRHEKTHTQEKVQIKKRRGGSEEVDETEAPKRFKPYDCMCGKTYTCSSHLYRHQRTHHEEIFSSSTRFRAADNKMEKPYKCECGRGYTSNSHLFRHQKTHEMMEFVVDDPDYDSDVHNEDLEEKPYQCECGKSFILWFSLMVHKRIHCKANLQTSSDQDSP